MFKYRNIINTEKELIAFNCLNFCNETAYYMNNQEFEKVDDLLFNGLLIEFIKLFKLEKNKLPYHINLLDEIHANENAHSRILSKLLQAKDSEYFLLISFLKYLGVPFSNLFSHSLSVTCDKNRIDLRIRSQDFSIIIENKIYEAIEQERQIDRYVENEELSGHSYNRKKNIFVLYLHRNENKRPSEYSFSKILEEDLEDRYMSISYQKTILPWLIEEALPNCRKKEEYLSSAIEQYIDHLKGLFHQRKNEKNMNEELKKYLFEKLEIKDKTIYEQFNILKNKENEVQEIFNYLQELRVEKEREKNLWILSEIKNKLINDFSDDKPRIDTEYIEYPKVIIPINSNVLPILNLTVEIDFEGKDVYFGIITDKSHIKDQRILDLFKDFYFADFNIESNNNNPNWYISKNSSFEFIYLEFKEFVIKIKELLK